MAQMHMRAAAVGKAYRYFTRYLQELRVGARYVSVNLQSDPDLDKRQGCMHQESAQDFHQRAESLG